MATMMYKVNDLLTTAEGYYEQEDYLNAFDYFNTAIAKMEDNGSVTLAQNGKPTSYAWAWAHKGRTHLAFAQTLDELDPRQDEHYNLALYSLNRAIGVDTPDNCPDSPLIDVVATPYLNNPDPDDSSAMVLNNLLQLLKVPAQAGLEAVEACQYAWALAQRGEVLRVTANKWSIWHKPERYYEAIECFWKAIEVKSPNQLNYSWTYAHLGATIVNARGWCRLDAQDNSSITDEEKQRHYDLAMQYIDMALEFKQHNYSWCLAYKGVLYLQEHEEEKALGAILSAIIQYPKLLDFRTVIRPPWEFGEYRTPEMLYAMSTGEYLLAKSGDTKPYSLMDRDTLNAYQLVHFAVRYTYRFWEIKILDKQHATLPRRKSPIETATDAVEKLSADKPDQHYLLGSLWALSLHGIPDTDKKGDEATKIIKEALLELRTTLDIARVLGGKPLVDHFKASARGDKAWYYLRKDEQFCQLTQHDELLQSQLKQQV